MGSTRSVPGEAISKMSFVVQLFAACPDHAPRSPKDMLHFIGKAR